MRFGLLRRFSERASHSPALVGCRVLQTSEKVKQQLLRLHQDVAAPQERIILGGVAEMFRRSSKMLQPISPTLSAKEIPAAPSIQSAPTASTTPTDPTAGQKPARLYITELNKIRNEYKFAPTVDNQRKALDFVEQHPLSRISGVDSKLIAHILSMLKELDAPPSMEIVESCALWVIGNNPGFAGGILVSILHSLRAIGYEDLPEVMDVTYPTLQKVIPDLAVNSAVMLLDLLTASPYTLEGITNSTTSGGQVSSARQMTTTSQSHDSLVQQTLPKAAENLDELSASELASLVASLGRLKFISNDSLIIGTFDTALLKMSKYNPKDLSTTDIANLLRGALCHANREEITPFIFRIFSAVEERKSQFSIHDLAIVANACYGIINSHEMDSFAAIPVDQSTQKNINAAISPGQEDNVSQLSVLLSELRHRVDKLIQEILPGKMSEISASDVAMLLTCCPSPIPPALVAAAKKVVQDPTQRWSTVSVRRVIRALHGVDELQAEFQSIVRIQIDRIQELARGQRPMDLSLLCSVLVPKVLEIHSDEFLRIASQNSDRWKLHEVCIFLTALSFLQTKASRVIMRDLAPRLVSRFQKVTPVTLTLVASAYGRARVRNDNLCEEIASRSVAQANDLTAYQLTQILAFLAAVDFRNNKCFLELAPRLRNLIPVLTASQVANLLAAYSKMMIWNYKLFYKLGLRALQIKGDFTLLQAVTVVAALNRMDIHQEELLKYFLQKVKPKVPFLNCWDCINILSAFSKAGVWDVELFNTLGEKVVEQANNLDAFKLGEVLMSFARVQLRDHQIFQDLSLAALALGPTCPPVPIAHIATAFAAVGCRHEELFSVLAERTLALKDECPAITIAAILAAFATIGIKNDRLFIEMIPRVRHIGQYGSPQDIANVVVAYTTMGLWHYRLFTRLADRAVTLRAECRGVEIAQILSSYARVEMRYDRLFQEFSPRIQSLAHTLGVSEIVAIAHSYASLKISDDALFRALADRATELVPVMEFSEAQKFGDALGTVSVRHETYFFTALRRFPLLRTSTSTTQTAAGAETPGKQLPASDVTTKEAPATADEETDLPSLDEELLAKEF